ncbi:PAS domain S-box protein [Phormidesmis sp. 146-33]
MQLPDSPPFTALQQAIDQWIETASFPDSQVQQVRSYLAEIGSTIAQLQAEISQSKPALQESEERYRRIIETATEGIWVLDTAEKTSFANGRLAQMLGYSVEEMLGKSLFDFMDAEGQAIAAQCLDRLRQGDQGQHDCKFLCKNGADLWAIVSATPIFTQGTYKGVLAMITDITERRRTRANLEQSLCLLQTTLEATADGILAIDISGNILNFNHKFSEQWGLVESLDSEQELLEKAIDQLQNSHVFLHQLKAEFEQPNLESQIILELKDGRVFERYSKPQRLDDQIIGRVISCRDITEAKRAEIALAEREKLLRTVVTNTPTILYALDRNGIFTLSEGKGLSAIRRKSGEVVGRSMFELYQDHPELLTAAQQVLAGSEGSLTIEVNGVIYDTRATPLRDKQDQVVGLIGVATDITAQKRAESVLRNAKERLEIRVEERTVELRSTNEQLQQEIAQRKQIEQSLRESQICLRLLNSITTGITAGLSVEQVIESTIQQIGRYFKTLRVLYGVIDDGLLTAVHSVQPETMPTLQGMVEDLSQAPTYLEIIDRRQPIIIQDVTQEAFLSPIAASMVARKACAILSVPVQHSNQKLGLLCFNAPEPREWSDYEVATLMEIADYLSIVLQEAQAQQERQRAEDRLRLLESVVVNGNDSVIITDANSDNPKIIYTNAAFTASTGYSAEEVLGKTPRILQGPKSNRVQLDKIRHALNHGKPIQIELLNYRKDGSEFWVDLNIVPIVDLAGNLTHYVALQRDITDRKWAEKALLATQARFKYLLSSNPSVIYTCQPNRNRPCTFVSENVIQQLGYEVWQYLKDPHFWIDRIHPDNLPNVLTKMSQLFVTEQVSCEYQFLHQDGSYRWLRDGMKLLRDRQGHPVEIIGSVVDITDRKRAENQIRESLQEKEVMLKEIHHRVKNNLQVISSLLKLQAGYIKDDRILEVFKESQNRVRAMALIHEKLYQSEDLAKTDFAEYIRSLVNDLFRSYSISSRAVSLNLTVEDVRLSIDTAIPCGLIINELVSNSLKYAFSTEKFGQISIALSAETNDRYLLVVQDDGSGLPSDIDFRKTKSLGLQLVCNLTRQLQGTLDLDRENGSTFKINFTDQKQKF